MKNKISQEQRLAEFRAQTTEQRLQELRAQKDLKRTATVLGVDVDARTVELSFSSEIEFRRWWGIEVLGHDADECDLSRLNDGAACLWNHNWDDQRGVVESASIDPDKKGRAKVRLSRSAAGEELLQDIADRIKTKVSVGYMIHDAKLVEERDDVEVWRITRWQPFEISVVSVPADPSVGVGRGLENPQEETAHKVEKNAPVSLSGDRTQKDTKKMITKNVRDAAGNLVKAEVDENDNIVRVIELVEAAPKAQNPMDAERSRQQRIHNLGVTFNARDLASEYIAEGKTPEEFQTALLERFNKATARPLAEQNRAAEIGMTDKEVRQFSFMRAIRHLADPTNERYRKEAAFELECSRAAATQYEKEPKGVLVPADVLSRAFSTTTPGAGPGSNIIATDLLASSFIDLLTKRAWVLRRATRLAGLVGNVDIPRQKSGTTTYWVGEGNAPTTSEIGVDKVSLTPKTLAAFSDITRRMLIQSTPDAEMLTRKDLVRSMALELDRIAIYGSGSANQPRGVKNIVGINVVDFAATNPTYAEIVQMETEIAADNADVGSMCYVGPSTLRGHLKTTQKFAGTNGMPIWEQGNTVNGYDFETTNQIVAGDSFFANWEDLLIAMWGGLDLTVDPYALATSGGVRVITFQDVDINARHPESFCNGVLVP